MRKAPFSGQNFSTLQMRGPHGRMRRRGDNYDAHAATTFAHTCMNVLVTGGAGFLGSYVVAGLEAAGHKAFAYDVAAPTDELLVVAPSLATSYLPGIDQRHRSASGGLSHRTNRCHRAHRWTCWP